jgi:hypothetical protein
MEHAVATSDRLSYSQLNCASSYMLFKNSQCLDEASGPGDLNGPPSDKCVRRTLQSLDTSKASGPDGIPAIVLKQCARVLATPLAKLFNLSLKQGYYPEKWKEARVQPAFKNDDHSCVTNYRPISLLPIVAKVLESLVNRHLMQYLERNQLLSDTQYGFRSKRSNDH